MGCRLRPSITSSGYNNAITIIGYARPARVPAYFVYTAGDCHLQRRMSRHTPVVISAEHGTCANFVLFFWGATCVLAFQSHLIVMQRER